MKRFHCTRYSPHKWALLGSGQFLWSVLGGLAVSEWGREPCTPPPLSVQGRARELETTGLIPILYPNLGEGN